VAGGTLLVRRAAARLHPHTGARNLTMDQGTDIPRLCWPFWTGAGTGLMPKGSRAASTVWRGYFYYEDGDNLDEALSRGGEIMGPVPFFKTKVKRTDRSRRT